MAALTDYLAWRGDIDFSAVPPNEVDSLIFSQIIYLDFSGIVPESKSEKGVTLLAAMKQYLKLRRGEKKTSLGALIPKEIILLATHAARSKRFGSLYLNGFINKIDEEDQSQFCAMTFNLGKQEKYIVFRGTDDTIVGWKESFNMSFMLPIPAQLEALKYVNESADTFDGTIYIGGHSKGGNLAVFSATEADEQIKPRIKAVYNNDGPGFTREFIESEKYIQVRDRIQTFVPESSIVGMLLEHEEVYEVVKSTQSGIFQHNALSWEVMGGAFIHLDTVTKESKRIDVDLKKWLSSMESEERKSFLDTVYEILVSTNAKTLSDLSADKLKLVKAWNALDDDSKKLIKRCIKTLLISSKKDKEQPESADGSVIAASAEKPNPKKRCARTGTPAASRCGCDPKKIKGKK